MVKAHDSCTFIPMECPWLQEASPPLGKPTILHEKVYTFPVHLSNPKRQCRHSMRKFQLPRYTSDSGSTICPSAGAGGLHVPAGPCGAPGHASLSVCPVSCLSGIDSSIYVLLSSCSRQILTVANQDGRGMGRQGF